MNSLDKFILQEANQVTSDDYKRLTGTSLEESMTRMKAYMAEIKARVTREESAKSKNISEKVIELPQTKVWQKMPVAAATPRRVIKGKNSKK